MRLSWHKVKVAELAGPWLNNHPRPRKSTNLHLAQMIKPFVRDFGTRGPASIGRLEARRWANAHRANVPAVRAFFNDLVDDEIVGSNPFAKLGLKGGRGRRDLVPLTEDQVTDLADCALELWKPGFLWGKKVDFGQEFRALVLFAAYVGLRPAELFVLERRDLDFENREVRITKSLGAGGEITPPKNGKPRTAVLLPQANDALPIWDPDLSDELLFTSPMRRRWSRTSHAHYWYPLRQAAGFPKLEFYELRHFCATHLLERGLSPEDVALQLGHTDGGALVRSTYGHPSEARARARILKAG